MTEPSRRHSFNAAGFYIALDLERASRRATWKDVAADSGVSASTLTRMKQGKRPDVDSLAALASWAHLDVDAFIEKGPGDAFAMPQISALLRADPNLSAASATAIEELLRMAYDRMRQDADS